MFPKRNQLADININKTFRTVYLGSLALPQSCFKDGKDEIITWNEPWFPSTRCFRQHSSPRRPPRPWPTPSTSSSCRSDYTGEEKTFRDHPRKRGTVHFLFTVLFYRLSCLYVGKLAHNSFANIYKLYNASVVSSMLIKLVQVIYAKTKYATWVHFNLLISNCTISKSYTAVTRCDLTKLTFAQK